MVIPRLEGQSAWRISVRSTSRLRSFGCQRASFSFVPVVRPGRLKECAVPAPSVGIALSERRIRVDFDPVLPRSQEEISEFIELGGGFCVVWSRIFRVVWVSDVAGTLKEKRRANVVLASGNGAIAEAHSSADRRGRVCHLGSPP